MARNAKDITFPNADTPRWPRMPQKRTFLDGLTYQWQGMPKIEHFLTVTNQNGQGCHRNEHFLTDSSGLPPCHITVSLGFPQDLRG